MIRFRLLFGSINRLLSIDVIDCNLEALYCFEISYIDMEDKLSLYLRTVEYYVNF